MTTKHTPGPWKVVRESDKGGWKGISIESPNGFVANMVMQLTNNELANARLIAAAPDLLDALRALRQACSARPDMQSRKYMDLGIQVNAAIAKAEGSA